MKHLHLKGIAASTSLGTTAAASRGQSAAQPVDGGTGPLRGVWNDPDDATTNINVAKSVKFRKLRTDESVRS